jgi:Type IV secretion-system coupling protein DNA-binding domain
MVVGVHLLSALLVLGWLALCLTTTVKNPPRVVLPVDARSTHLHVVGQPGTGKSRALESWIMQDIAKGHGVGVIDPHGEMFDHLLSRLAGLLPQHPELAERVVIINPQDPTWTVGFNPLEVIQGFSTERLAAFLTDVVIKIWRVDTASAPRMIRLLTFTFLALSELGLTLAELPRFLTDTDWREELLGRLAHQDAANFFRFEFPKSPGLVHQWVAPVLNKVGAFLFDRDLRLMFSISSTINFRHILDRELVLLVNLSKGHLGEGNSALLGAFIVAHLQKAALARDELAKQRPFYLYLDEFQNYTTGNIIDILSESRKYGLSLILAHQYLSQLGGELLDAVLNTTGTLASFRVGYQDASRLSHELFPPAFLEKWQRELRFLRVGRFPIPYPHTEREPLSREELAMILTQLEQREFVARRRGPYPPRKQRTLEMPTPRLSDALWQAREQLVKNSGQLYGRLKSEARSEYDGQHGQWSPKSSGITDITDYEEI